MSDLHVMVILCLSMYLGEYLKPLEIAILYQSLYGTFRRYLTIIVENIRPNGTVNYSWRAVDDLNKGVRVMIDAMTEATFQYTILNEHFGEVRNVFIPVQFPDSTLLPFGHVLPFGPVQFLDRAAAALYVIDNKLQEKRKVRHNVS